VAGGGGAHETSIECPLISTFRPWPLGQDLAGSNENLWSIKLPLPWDKKIFEMWLACHTNETIGEENGCDKATVTRVVDDLLQDGKLAKSQQATDSPRAENMSLHLYRNQNTFFKHRVGYVVAKPPR
jgi:hypothetical protein